MTTITGDINNEIKKVDSSYSDLTANYHFY